MSEPASKKRPLKPEEIDRAVIAMLETASEDPDMRVAVAGGVALQAYGSPRETTDVDFLSNWTLGPQRTFAIDHPLSFGGLSYLLEPGAIIVDLIVRNDAYQTLYEEALANAIDQGGVPIVSPDYLAALKFAANREKDRVDLAWLLGSGLVDVGNVGDILGRHLGGRAALDVWNKMSSRMLLAIKRNKRKARG